MNILPFIKMHGCGNAYVFVDAMAWSVTQAGTFDYAGVARQVSDRHRSIGSDGLVVMLASDRSDADARMRMFNADGSEGILCGNALRCMALWLHQSGRCETRCRIAMHDRIIDAEVLRSEPHRKRAIVRVVIGTPVIVSPAATGLQRYLRHVTLPDVWLHGQPLQLITVMMGNSHAILLVQDLETVPVDTLGPQVERHLEFPQRTNVEFVQITNANRALVRVWERGSGETQACGSGACATAVMGWATGLFEPNAPVQIWMPGGDLSVHLLTNNVVALEGPAEEACRGEVQILLPELDSAREFC
ncbi:MAG: diaminopimelate epimerase [Planctomycetota bacterium]|jgi:diaminopimelate epimerase|nr:MAG: diaminopimelate epimerase [Planctomycetota bacterium]